MAEQFFVTETVQLTRPIPSTGSVVNEYPVQGVTQECKVERQLCICKALGTVEQLNAIAADTRVLAIPRSNLKRRVDTIAPNVIANAQSWINAHGLETQIADHATLRLAVNALGQELAGAGFDLSSLGILGGSPASARRG